jgi:hypothetical protein
MYFVVLFLLTAAVTTTTKSYDISFINQAMTVNKKAMVKYNTVYDLVVTRRAAAIHWVPTKVSCNPKTNCEQPKIVITAIVTISLATLYSYL